MAYGNVEFGTLLDENDHSIVLGRLAIDYDTREFWQRPATGDRAFPVNWKNIAHYLAVGAIQYDDPQMEKRLLGFLQRKEKSDEILKEADRIKDEHNRRVKEVEENNKLIRQTRSRAVMARMFWVMGCLAAIAITFVATIPPAPAPAAEPSIAGYGADYGVPSEQLEKASYVAALGDATNLYGIIVDQDIIEVGTASTGESTIKENVMLNPYISEQPIHMRPLYYNRQTFYQSSLAVNDSTGGSSAVYLQNPKGYKEGKAANDLVLTGGAGISAITIASPDAYQDLSGSEAADLLEAQQESMAEDDSQYEDPDRAPSAPPEGWIGFDSCDIDGSWIVASYWYHQPEVLGGRLMRRVIMYDVQNVIDNGAAGLEQMNSANMNYQIQDSSYYDPVVSVSRATNGQVHWIGYMKQTAAGDSGFFVRRVQSTTDILNEDKANTFSVWELTDSKAPITNYTLDGDMLFFEQAGYIWYIDLSKIQATINQYESKKSVSKNKPVQICSVDEIRPTVTRDEEFTAQQNGVAVTPRAHYKVMKIIASGENIEYGVVFEDAVTGNLVFCPTHAIIVAGSSESNVTRDSNASDVQDQSGAEVDRIKREDEGVGEYADDYNPNANQQQQQQTTAGGVTASTDGHEARAWQPAAADVPGAHAWTVDDTTITKVIVALSDRGDASFSVVAFTVRGEHVIWIEENKATHERAVKCSPIYYKNDAVKIMEQIFGEEEDTGDNLSQVEQNQINQGQQFQQNQAQQQAQQQQAQPQQDAQAEQQQQQQQQQPAGDAQAQQQPDQAANQQAQVDQQAGAIPQTDQPQQVQPQQVAADISMSPQATGGDVMQSQGLTGMPQQG